MAAGLRSDTPETRHPDRSVAKWRDLATPDFYVYILTNKMNDVLYIGVTNNIERRLYEHQNHIIKGFTSKYRVHKLVHLELFDDPINAITREKQLKKWRRSKKVDLINKQNPDWADLSEIWYRPDPSTSGNALRSG